MVGWEAQGESDVPTPSSPILAPTPKTFLGYEVKGQRPPQSPAEKLGGAPLGQGKASCLANKQKGLTPTLTCRPIVCCWIRGAGMGLFFLSFFFFSAEKSH